MHVEGAARVPARALLQPTWGREEDAMNDDIQGNQRVDEPDPVPASAAGGESARPDRGAPARRSGQNGEDDAPDSDESGGPTAPQRPPSDS
jgi:hypothetical protein